MSINITIKSLAENFQISISKTIVDYNQANPKIVTKNTSNYFLVSQDQNYVINIWKDNQNQGNPNSWFSIDSTGNITESHIGNFKIDSISVISGNPSGFIITIIDSSFWERYYLWIIFGILIILVIFTIPLVVYYWKTRSRSESRIAPELKPTLPGVSLFNISDRFEPLNLDSGQGQNRSDGAKAPSLNLDLFS